MSARRWAASWRVAARIARRDAVRARGRTALVATMIGLPVLVGSAAGVLTQSSQVTPERRVVWDLGQHAQARIEAYWQAGLEQSADGGAAGTDGSSEAEVPDLEPYEADLAAVLPPGDRLVRTVERFGSIATGERTTGERTTDGDQRLTEIPAADMAALVIPPVTAGTLPEAPGEVAVGAQVADELGVGVGDEVSVTSQDADPVTVRVSAVLAPWPRSWGVVGVSGSLLPAPGDARGGGGSFPVWYVLGDTPVTWDVVERVNALGSTVGSRTLILDPSSARSTLGQGGGVSTGTLAVVAGVGAMALVEAVLLIGPAFAVGTRRSQRQLALLAATGAERRVLRRVGVLDGVVVGLGASTLAAAAGVGIGTLVQRVSVARGSFALPDLRIPWWTIPVMLALGTLVATAAAAVPARRASRVDVVAALAGRRAEARPRRSVPVLGIVLAGAGVALALAGATTRTPMLIVPGVLAVELGIVLASGALVSLLARLSPRLGVAGRFAVRDAARQRGRTAPALAAIVAAIGGLTAGVVYLESQAAQQQASYEPLGTLGTVSVGAISHQGVDLPGEGDVDAAGEVLRGTLPVSDVAAVRVAVPPAGSSDPDARDDGWLTVDEMARLEVVRTPENECQALAGDFGPGTAEAAADDDRCPLPTTGALVWWVPETFSRWVVDDGTVVRMLAVAGAEKAAEALAAGKVVVRSPYDLQPDGTVRVVLRGSGDETLASADLPAVVVDLGSSQQLGVVLPPSAVDELGLGTTVVGLVAATSQLPTQQQLAAARSALDDTFIWDLHVERGPLETWAPLVWIVAGAAILLGLAATGISVALAAAESRPDLATLGAVGAAPRMRRRIAAAQAGVLAVSGALLGVLTGLLLARVLVTAQRAAMVDPRWVTVVPWPVVAVILVGVPALAMGGAWALTRSRLPMVRRVVG